MENSPRFSINKNELQHVGKVFVWSMCSAMITIVTLLVAKVEVPKEYASIFVLLTPSINALAVGIKKWLSEHGSLL